jgi:hypothetical protein
VSSHASQVFFIEIEVVVIDKDAQGKGMLNMKYRMTLVGEVWKTQTPKEETLETVFQGRKLSGKSTASRRYSGDFLLR